MKIFSNKKIKASVLSKFNLEIVHSIQEAEACLFKVNIDKSSIFEIDPMTTIQIAHAQSLNLPIVTYGYPLNLIPGLVKEHGLVFKNGILIKENTSKFINGENIDLGDFLYENAHGNGMIFMNHHILNIYKNNKIKALEILVNLFRLRNNKKPKFNLFSSIEDMDSYVLDSYPVPEFFSPLKLSDSVKDVKPKHSNRCYLMGDDVFFLSETETKDILFKHKLLSDRKHLAKKFGFKAVTPLEMEKDLSIAEVILGNNGLAKYSKYFQANLHKMPLEKSAVDTGTLYEIALNIYSGGNGIVHIDSYMKKNKELYTWLKNHTFVIKNSKERKIFKQLKEIISPL